MHAETLGLRGAQVGNLCIRQAHSTNKHNNETLKCVTLFNIHPEGGKKNSSGP